MPSVFDVFPERRGEAGRFRSNFSTSCWPGPTSWTWLTREKQFFKCFGCGEGGNAIHFVMKIENLPYIDAIHKLADLAGMEVPQDEDGGKSRLRRQRL